jgi:ribose 5-phosphate isomerase B
LPQYGKVYPAIEPVWNNGNTGRAFMRIVVGADHAGFSLKNIAIRALEAWGYDVEDAGTYDTTPVDFPIITRELCDPLRSGEYERGILICGTGVGASMAANKIPGIRAALCHDAYSAHQCVEHDNANVLCLGAQIVGDRLALDLIMTFLKAEWSTDAPFRRRVSQLTDLEQAAADELRPATPR